MANKMFWPGMLILALVFGTIGCDNASNDGSAGGSGVDPDDITYTVEANGTLDTETSTQLTFTFSDKVSGLGIGNIDIFDGTGAAEINTSKPIKEILTGGETSWTLNIRKVTAGSIRVRIAKEGIEPGRKTVIVHQNTVPASSKKDAKELPSDGDWEEGFLADNEDVVWFKFDAKAGTDYYVEWTNHNHSGYTANLYVTAYQSDDTQIWSASSYDPRLVEKVSGTVYLKVTLDIWSRSGAFAIRYYDPDSMYPINVLNLGIPELMFDGSVMVKWGVYGGDEKAAKLGGYRVYRSEKEDGSYTMLIDITDTSVRTYNDIDVTGGKTYWYKVAAYNSKGEGEPTAPWSIEIPEDVGIPLTVGGDYTEGEIDSELGSMQIDWYNFTAEAGKTYEVQWLGSNDEIPGSDGDTYRAMLMVSAFNSDKTQIAQADWNAKTLAISGVNGKVFIKVQQSFLAGTYAIRVVQKK